MLGHLIAIFLGLFYTRNTCNYLKEFAWNKSLVGNILVPNGFRFRLSFPAFMFLSVCLFVHVALRLCACLWPRQSVSVSPCPCLFVFPYSYHHDAQRTAQSTTGGGSGAIAADLPAIDVVLVQEKNSRMQDKTANIRRNEIKGPKTKTARPRNRNRTTTRTRTLGKDQKGFHKRGDHDQGDF